MQNLNLSKNRTYNNCYYSSLLVFTSHLNNCFIGLPAFEEIELPHFVKGTWSNANQILKINGVKDNPFFKSKKLVASLTSDKYHDVTLQGNKLRYSRLLK